MACSRAAGYRHTMYHSSRESYDMYRSRLEAGNTNHETHVLKEGLSSVSLLVHLPCSQVEMRRYRNSCCKWRTHLNTPKHPKPHPAQHIMQEQATAAMSEKQWDSVEHMVLPILKYWSTVGPTLCSPSTCLLRATPADPARKSKRPAHSIVWAFSSVWTANPRS